MRRVPMAAAAVLLAVSVPMTVTAYDIPEAAVRDYLDGVAQADMERVIDATAVDELAERYRFERMVERLKSYQPFLHGPVHSPFFAEAERMTWASERGREARTLAYTLLAPDKLGEAHIEPQPIQDVGAPWATDLIDELVESRLAGLRVVDIGQPHPELIQSDRYLELMALNANTYGADEVTDRVALLEFEGETYAIGFQLIRYGDEWKVLQQHSPSSGLPGTGAARPMSSGEFEAMISE